MKKLIALLLVLAMVFSLAACGSSRNNNWDDDDDRYEDRDDRDDEDEDDDREDRDHKEEDEEEDEDVPALDLPADMQTEFTIVENEDIVFSITDIDPRGDWGYTLHVYMENNTDQELVFNLEDVAVNGRMCDPYWSCVVAPGMKANEEVSFFEDDFERNGITDVTGIQFCLMVYDYNDWTIPQLVNEVFNIYPYGQEYYTPCTYKQKQKHTVLFDTDEFFVAVTEFEPDGEWGYTMKLYAENRTDAELVYDMELVSVNGIMCDPYFSAYITAGNTGYYDIYWSENQFDMLDIKKVDDITFSMFVNYTDSWDDPLVGELFTLFPDGGDMAKPYTYDFDGGELLLWEDETCAVYILGAAPDYSLGYALDLLLVNKTDLNLTFTASSVAVNGFMMDPYWGENVAAGKCALSQMGWFQSDFDSNGVTDVEQLDLELIVYDYDDWYSDVLLDEYLTADLLAGTVS